MCSFAGGLSISLGVVVKKSEKVKHLLPDKILRRIRKPSKRINLIVIFCIVLIIVIPTGYFVNYVNSPQLEIELVSITAPNQLSTMDIYVRLKNNGITVADERYIEMKFVFSNRTLKFGWPNYLDIDPDSSVGFDFKVEKIQGDNLVEVAVYYLDVKSDTFRL